MRPAEDKNELNTSPIQDHKAGPTGSLFFAAIIYSGNNRQLSATLNSVLRQRTSGALLDIKVFCQYENVPQLVTDNDVSLVPYQNNEDFFSKFTDAVDQSPAQYCMALWCGEELFDGAFDSAERIFGNQPQVNWLTGIQTFQAKGGFNITLGTTAMRRWSYKIYERNLYKNSGRFIPPASTFWRKSIWAAVSSGIHFVDPAGFCEDLWLAFFKTEKLYTCKAYFSTSGNYTPLSIQKLKLPDNYSLVEDSLLGKVKEFFFINNVPYLRLFYRNEGGLAPVIRFDHATQSYFLSKY